MKSQQADYSQILWVFSEIKMKLSKKQFEYLLASKKLVIALIGMSNMGKTYWSKKLTRVGFAHINCDDLIETKLAKELKRYGYKGIKDVSKWMGQPYDRRYMKNQNTYLSLEKEVMQSILDGQIHNINQNTVIDTTGSVIHTGRSICGHLKKKTLVVYIQSNQAMKEEMFRNYIQNPKPVVFGRVFKKNKNETNLDALGQSYKRLLKKRESLYEKYADVKLPREKIKKSLKTKEFINLIKKSL